MESLAIALLAVFCTGFVALGTRFLWKKRTERIDQLTELLEGMAPNNASVKAGHPWAVRLKALLTGKKNIDPDLYRQLEEILVTADVGIRTTQKLLQTLAEKSQEGEAFEQLKGEIGAIFAQTPNRPLANGKAPAVYLIVGVNGVGKTTTIGKLAQTLRDQGKKVLLAAGDTYRAAAKEQLGVWAERTGSGLAASDQPNADPASVLFDAVKKAQAEGYDVVLCDTAGRLHTKTNLMDELRKVHKVVGKALEGAPHEVLLVLDATTGQNALLQAQQFMDVTPLTGLILTKLDGTAKGGIAIAVVNETGVPIRFIGVGEKANDLQPFNTNEFINGLFGA